MKAVRIHEEGGPDVLRYEDVPDPEPGEGEVLVRLAAASLNHLDVWVRMGLPSVPKPRILGADGAGVVAALGPGVEGFAVGDRVVLNPGLEHGPLIAVLGEHSDGTHCELIAVAAEQVFPLDDALSFEEAAAFPLVYETAYRMLVTKAAVQEGEWVLIWGIGGGVATAAFEICRALGVRTIVTSGSDAKLEHARAWGADVAVNHHTGDVVEAAREATGKGVDVVVESVGEATWARSLAAVAPAGSRDGLRRHVRAKPAGGTAPLLVEAADRLRVDDGLARGLPRRLRARLERPRARAHRQGVSSGRDACRPRAARGGRPARQDRPLDPRLTASTCAGAGPHVAVRHPLEPRLRGRGDPFVGLEVPLALLAVDDRGAHAEAERRGTRSRRR